MGRGLAAAGQPSEGNFTTTAAEMLLTQRDIALRAACTIDPGVIDRGTSLSWRRVKIHGVPVTPYVDRGSGGTDKLRESSRRRTMG